MRERMDQARAVGNQQAVQEYRQQWLEALIDERRELTEMTSGEVSYSVADLRPEDREHIEKYWLNIAMRTGDLRRSRRHNYKDYKEAVLERNAARRAYHGMVVELIDEELDWREHPERRQRAREQAQSDQRGESPRHRGRQRSSGDSRRHDPLVHAWILLSAWFRRAGFTELPDIGFEPGSELYVMSWAWSEGGYSWDYEADYNLEERTLSVWIGVHADTPDAVEDAKGQHWLRVNDADDIENAMEASTRAYLSY
jgi:hypothetical protein